LIGKVVGVRRPEIDEDIAVARLKRNRRGCCTQEPPLI
jgi:hypothetical protein